MDSEGQRKKEENKVLLGVAIAIVFYLVYFVTALIRISKLWE